MCVSRVIQFSCDEPLTIAEDNLDDLISLLELVENEYFMNTSSGGYQAQFRIPQRSHNGSLHTVSISVKNEISLCSSSTVFLRATALLWPSPNRKVSPLFSSGSRTLTSTE
jgi:hypothetical protein